jgi:RND family efflux transporter MFP subunit
VRWKELLAHDAVSQQEYDEKAGDLAAKSSLVDSASANVARLQAMTAFKRVTAPFDGVVTARAAHVGALVSTGGTDTPLYTIADVRKLRVFIRLPQSYVAQVKPGMVADLTSPERPKEVFQAKVVGDAQALNSQSGTLLVELQYDNAAGRLKAGGYAQASFKLPIAVDVATLPASALMYRTQGPVVATVDGQGVVTIRPVSIARDLGSSVQLASGVNVGAQVVDNPPDSLASGDKVHVLAPKAKPANG